MFRRSMFTPHPEGPTVGTFVDWKEEEGDYGPQTRCDFDTEEVMEDGRAFRIAFWIRDAFNPKSNSYKFMKALGVDVDAITDEELEAFDLDSLLHRRCHLMIKHTKKNDGTIKATIESLTPLKRGGTRETARPQAPASTPAPTRRREVALAPVDPFIDPWEDEAEAVA